MLRTLMFKSNPLTQEFELYRRKNAQTLQVKPFSIKSNLKKHQKSPLHKNVYFSEIRNTKNIRYDQFKTINQNSSAFTERTSDTNDGKKYKCKFKIHNTVTTKNDNFLQKDQFLTTKDQNYKNQIKDLKAPLFNPQAQKHNNINEDSIVSRHRSRKTNRKANLGQINIGNLINLNEEKPKKPKDTDLQVKNQLKSTLYQSIDLGNLFEKIESNIEQSQKMASSQLYMNSKPYSPNFSNAVTKKTQIKRVQLNKNETKEAVLDGKVQMNKFNLKNLIEKNGTVKPKDFPQKILDKSFFQSLTSRAQNSEKKDHESHKISQMDGKINEDWMTTARRKRSMAIVMDENGVIKEESSGIAQNEADSLRMSMKISNLRQIMKGEQLEFE